MKHVGIFEAKTHLSSLLDEVEKGGEVTITRHGKPVAKLVQATDRVIARSDCQARAGDRRTARHGAKTRGITVSTKRSSPGSRTVAIDRRRCVGCSLPGSSTSRGNQPKRQFWNTLVRKRRSCRRIGRMKWRMRSARAVADANASRVEDIGADIAADSCSFDIRLSTPPIGSRTSTRWLKDALAPRSVCLRSAVCSVWRRRIAFRSQPSTPP